ncbi:MAG: ferredoxin-type protein NapF [Gammaproteobacteria bacterium]|nr:MAG: ferredoxin-type protein NapF [Gammaproteobacteria bacterium]
MQSLTRRQLFTRRRQPAVRPPWALAEEAFVSACTRCGDCIRMCEAQVLIKGDGGFPEFDASRGECTFCEVCVQACTTHALDLAQASVQPARPVLSEACIAQKGVECRICGDQCEAEAIVFRPRPGGRFEPELNLTACTGCGACVAPCPVRAIVLKPVTQEVVG